MGSKKTRRENVLFSISKPGVLAVSVLLIFLVGLETFNLAWGSGHFVGRLSLKWTSILGFYSFFVTTLLILLYVGLFSPTRLNYLRMRLLAWREGLSRARWLLVLIFATLPAYFVFYSPWGGLFAGFFTRLFLFFLTIAVVAFLLASRKEGPFSWRSFLLAGLFIGSLHVLAESFVLVSNYPFALHWSEGNRLWDYSILFGRARYNFPTDQPIFAWIDPGRQALWGLPFLLSSLPLWAARLWSAFLTTVPYALLGWFAFRSLKNARGQWLAAGLWALVFLNQGPIYTPLIFAAILVAAARRRPIWLALPLIYLAGLYAGSSRFTWAFAPAIWAVMLTFSDGVLLHRQVVGKAWLRATALGLAGIWTKGLPVLLGLLSGFLPISIAAQATPPLDATPGAQGITTLQGLQVTATGQPFIWYRLLPNDVYPPGILLGLVLATLPLIALLLYLARHSFWKTVAWQRVAVGGGLIAFLLVGVIASVKVGGGADLHNLDMFLITLVLLAGVAWEAGFYKHLSKFLQGNSTVRWLLGGMILIPALVPMVTGKPLVLPGAERTQFVLQQIQDKVACARQYGEVLFMDQRQLITFGQMGDLPLVVDYEKKFVMDQALAGNKPYFDQFEADLAAGHFSLIVSEREGTLYKELDQESVGDSLVEENNAWVHWVSMPLLTYYESTGNYKDAAVELFIPIERNFDCP
jgi:hypothetical protein